MGNPYELPLSDLLPAITKDLMSGSADAAPMIRDVLDAAIKRGETVSDLLLTQFPTLWAELVKVTASKTGGITLPAETP